MLVTSREEITGFYLKPLDFLSEQQAIELFKKYYTHQKLTDRDIKELVAMVDYHTLTIEILAKTAKVQRYDAATLKGAVEKDLKANIEVSHNRGYGKIEKISTYLRTVFSLSKLSENEIWLLKQFACLPSEFHTYDLLNELLIEEESPYKDIFAETLADIAQKGWLLQNKATDSYKMHRIIAEVVKKEQLINPADVQSLIAVIKQKLSLDQNIDNPNLKFIWIPYGKALLANFQEDISVEIAELQNNLAIMLQTMGDYYGAKILLEKAMHSTEKNFGKEHPNTATSYSNLAIMLQDLGDYMGAEILLKKALCSDIKNFGENHPTTALRYSNLATVFQDLGYYKVAKTLLEKALLSDKENFGENHPATATSYSNFAAVLQKMGDLVGAKYFSKKALCSDKKTFGESHPNTAIKYSNLAMVLRDLGEYKGAKNLLEIALLSDEKSFGEGHPNTAIRYGNLAFVLRDMGDVPKALELSKKALTIFKNFFPEGHFYITETISIINQLNKT